MKKEITITQEHFDRMEKMGILRKMTEDEMRPYVERDLKRLHKTLDKRILEELEKHLKNDNNPKTI